jgi:hypothetical protein
MAAEIVRRYRESLPALRLLGRRYSDADRNRAGGYGHLWGEWMGTGRFAPLDALPHVAVEGDAYVGAMRRVDGVFEYWIGMLCAEGTPSPDGYDSEDLPASDFYTIWLHGREDTGELYGSGPMELLESATSAEGLSPREGGWCFERYGCPRFTTPDADGAVILDYCLQVVPGR